MKSRNAHRAVLAVLTFGMAGLALGATAAGADGKAVYEKTCAACHAFALANAPKFGDKAAWAPRAATGDAALLASVLKGKGAMPPKGGANHLKNHEIQAAISFMLAAAR